MTKKKTATETVAKKPVAKKAPAKKKVTTKEVDVNAVTLEEYSMEMTIPTGQYANIRPRIGVKAYSMDKAHDFIAPHMNKLWKEYYLINERRPEPVKATVAPTAKPFVPTPGSETSTPQAPITTTTSTGGLSNATYLTDPKTASPDTRPLTFDEIKAAVGGKEVSPEDITKGMTPDDIFPDTPSPASSVAYNKATQAIESCMSLDALEIIRAQVDKSVKLTQEDKEALQPLLMERLNKLSNGF